MTSKVFSASFLALDVSLIEVEADISQGLPAFYIVGMGDTAVQESKERVRSSIKNTGLQFPMLRKTVNLAPAQIPKQGSLFDLPIAIALLVASEQIPKTLLKDSLFVGELSLDAKLKKIPGALAITHQAKKLGFKRIFLPHENAIEASFISGIKILAFHNLEELIASMRNSKTLAQGVFNVRKESSRGVEKLDKIASIQGMELEKRALAIAATGGHNLLLSGPPGSGKTLLARAMRELLPKMTKHEMIESTKLYSVANMLDKRDLINTRPFREVHHSASMISLIGGGNKAQPGEISLAHNGVLFLDEIVEFPRGVLESLRQPLEDKYVSLTRARYRTKLPANFTLIATANPCPCGPKNNNCFCAPSRIERYRAKLSGPILDRIDIFIHVQNKTMNQLPQPNYIEAAQLKKSVTKATDIQLKRYAKIPQLSRNADLKLGHLGEFCRLDYSSQKLLNQAANSLNLSNRSYVRSVKLARSIADLEAKANITREHIAEALQYRQVDLF